MMEIDNLETDFEGGQQFFLELNFRVNRDCASKACLSNEKTSSLSFYRDIRLVILSMLMLCRVALGTQIVEPEN